MPASWWTHQRSCWTWMLIFSPAIFSTTCSVWVLECLCTCFCSEVGKQSGFSTWRLQTTQSWQASPWLMKRFISFSMICFVLHLYFLPSFERHGLVVDGVQEEVMDDFLRNKSTSDYVFLLCCTSSSSWGGTLKRESWEIWYLLHNKSMSKKPQGSYFHLILFCSPSLKSLSSSSPTTSRGLMKALPLFRGSRATRTKVASVHLAMKDTKLIQTNVAIAQDSRHGPPTSSTAHQPAGPTADWTQQSCCPPTWCARTSGCRSPPCKELQSLEQTNIWNMEYGWQWCQLQVFTSKLQ